MSAQWHAYLDDLEADALELEAAILAGEEPAFREPPPRPQQPPPVALRARVSDVLATVERAAAIIATIQDGVAERLAHLPPEHVDQLDRPETLGGRLDLLG